jgi:hypothetical protein
MPHLVKMNIKTASNLTIVDLVQGGDFVLDKAGQPVEKRQLAITLAGSPFEFSAEADGHDGKGRIRIINTASAAEDPVTIWKGSEEFDYPIPTASILKSELSRFANLQTLADEIVKIGKPKRKATPRKRKKPAPPKPE